MSEPFTPTVLRGCDTNLEDAVRLLVGTLARSATTSDIVKVADKLGYTTAQKRRISALLSEVSLVLKGEVHVAAVDTETYRITEYDCGDGVIVRLCPEMVQSHKTFPEYWYIRRDCRPWDNRDLWNAGFKTLYWTDRGWWHCTPIQFPTAADAIQYHKERIVKKEE